MSAICVMGAAASGKSCLIKRFVSGYFQPSARYEPTLGDTYTKPVEKNGTSFTVSIRDTAGIYHFEAMRNNDIKLGAVFIVTFAIDNMFHWKEVPEVIENIRKISPQAPLALVGCKTDLNKDRGIKEQVARDFAAQMGVSYFECSSKEGTGIAEIFRWAVNNHPGK